MQYTRAEGQLQSKFMYTHYVIAYKERFGPLVIKFFLSIRNGLVIFHKIKEQATAFIRNLSLFQFSIQLQ